jgi:hypothetical protein
VAEAELIFSEARVKRLQQSPPAAKRHRPKRTREKNQKRQRNLALNF